MAALTGGIAALPAAAKDMLPVKGDVLAVNDQANKRIPGSMDKVTIERRASC